MNERVAQAPGGVGATDRSGEEPLGWQTIAVYAVPSIAVAGPSMFIQFYFLSYATDVLLLAPGLVGLILAVGRVWDAISDPLAGYGSDRTRGRFGRRRPWLAAAAPVAALSFIALWSPPAGVAASAGALTLWTALALFVVTTGFTAWSVPHQAWAVELSSSEQARTRLFGVRFAVALVGAALSFGGMQFVGNADDPRAAAAALSWALGAAMVLLLLVPPLALRERVGGQTAALAPPYRAYADVLASPRLRRLLAVWFFAQMGMSAQGIVAPYMARYVFARPELMGVLPALFIGPLVVSIPVWVWAAGRFGPRRVWLVAMALGVGAYAVLTAVPVAHLGITAVLLAVCGFATGATGPIGPSLFATLVDEDAERSGERREGVIFAAKESVEKASSAMVALMIGFALQLAAFEPNVEQSAAVQLVIRACLGLLPSAALLLALLIFRRLGPTHVRG